MTVQIRLTLVVRNGCHLCEVAQSDLARVIGRFAAEYPAVEYQATVTDIEDDADYARFTDEVPVLLLNGNQIAFWRIDEERVSQKLRELV
jgi:hypothetical protein